MRPAKSAAVVALEEALDQVKRQEEALRKGNEARAVLRSTMRDLSKLAKKVGSQPKVRVVRRRRRRTPQLQAE